MTLELFPRCVLPGCSNPVDTQGHPCGDCRKVFGNMLHHTPGGRRLTADQQEARNAETVAAYTARLLADPGPRRRIARDLAAERGEIDKRNQLCWMCEERRLCTLINGKWECRACQEIT